MLKGPFNICSKLSFLHLILLFTVLLLLQLQGQVYASHVNNLISRILQQHLLNS